MEEFVNVLQEAVSAFLLAVIPALVAYLAVYLKTVLDKKKLELENSKPQLAWAIQQAVSLAVMAAEQLGLNDIVFDKKQYAFQVAQQWLDDNGWEEVNIDVLDAAIEAAVLAKFNSVDSHIERMY